jgi:hypothetical protein
MPDNAKAKSCGTENPQHGVLEAKTGTSKIPVAPKFAQDGSDPVDVPSPPTTRNTNAPGVESAAMVLRAVLEDHRRRASTNLRAESWQAELEQAGLVY